MLSLRHFGLVLFIPWRVGAEESGAAKDGFGGSDAARPARAAWAVQRLAARWRGRRRRRRRRFRFIDLGLLISAPAFTSTVTLKAREALNGHRSARTYGVAWQREGSRQNSRRPPRYPFSSPTTGARR